MSRKRRKKKKRSGWNLISKEEMAKRAKLRSLNKPKGKYKKGNSKWKNEFVAVSGGLPGLGKKR